MSTPDPVDEALAGLQPAEPPAALQPRAEQAFRNYAEEARKPTASAWRFFGRWVEPVVVGGLVLLFVVWALMKVF